jgi:hypothetical protein
VEFALPQQLPVDGGRISPQRVLPGKHAKFATGNFDGNIIQRLNLKSITFENFGDASPQPPSLMWQPICNRCAMTVPNLIVPVFQTLAVLAAVQSADCPRCVAREPIAVMAFPLNAMNTVFLSFRRASSNICARRLRVRACSLRDEPDRISSRGSSFGFEPSHFDGYFAIGSHPPQSPVPLEVRKFYRRLR